MISFRYGNPTSGRNNVLDTIRDCKAIGNYAVLDIGACDNPWNNPDAILDIHQSNFSGRTFIGNINDADGWTDIMSYTSINGKFDFCVCSHTLEDIAYPALALRMLPYIARAGYIASPSHYRELSRGVEWSSQYRGHIHHRWILAPDQGVLTLVPKISALEYMPDILGDMSEDKAELQVWWIDTIPFKVLNDDYLGPNQPYVIKMYEDLFRRIG
jgi:hypothetical protein